MTYLEKEYSNMFSVIENLEDAGCGKEMIEEFLIFQEKGLKTHQLCILSEHRKNLLVRIHEEQKKLDCLDYLIYQMKKGKVGN